MYNTNSFPCFPAEKSFCWGLCVFFESSGWLPARVEVFFHILNFANITLGFQYFQWLRSWKSKISSCKLLTATNFFSKHRQGTLLLLASKSDSRWCSCPSSGGISKKWTWGRLIPPRITWNGWGGDPTVWRWLLVTWGRWFNYLIYVDTHPAEVTHLSEQMMTCDMCVNL